MADNKPTGATAPVKGAPAVETADAAKARRERVLAQAEEHKVASAPTRDRYKLADGEEWHAMPTGGECAITLDDQGVERIVELTERGRVRRGGVSVLAVITLIDAGRL